MSSQASSAGNDEKEVRKKIIETGDVDVMIAIKSGFFYTRTVPCELWHFDRTKPEDRKDKVLMLDARSMGQLMKGSRKVYEFTQEQMRDMSAIVWLYRGQRDRFLALVKDYFGRLCAESTAVSEKIAAFDTALKAPDPDFDAIAKAVKTVVGLDAEKCKLVTETLAELRDAAKAYTADRTGLLSDLAAFVKSTSKTPPATNDKQHVARKAFDPIAERVKGLIKQVDLLYKLASRITGTAAEIAANEDVAAVYDRREAGKRIKQLDEQRRAAVEQLKHAAYFHRHIVWLQDRFPDAAIQPVPGLVKVVTKKEIAEADWSLSPARYVGIAPQQVDADFDFEQAITDIHTELAALNKEAAGLAKTIQNSLEDLGL
jgi:type I restriction enzyme M protein